MGNWNPNKVNPFAGLFGTKSQQPKPAEPPRRVSMRAMKAVDLKKLSADDVLEVDEFSFNNEAGMQDASADVERQDARERAREKALKQGHQPPPGTEKPSGPRKDLPSLKPQAFGAPQAAEIAQAAQAAVTRAVTPQKLPARPVDPKFSALVALNSAQDPGVYFKEDREREGHREEDEDPELREAVEECIRLLFGVRGIHHVGPGKSDSGEPVIVIAAGDGFSQESMRAVPERVHRFATLVALPFDLVPLRRSR